MGRILLVRHGQSEWNAEGRWQGQADIPLSELGRRQAQSAVANLGMFDVVVSSTLARAAETAHIVCSGLGIGPIIPVPDLVERSAGEWSGLTRDDIHRDWPGYLEADKRPPSYELDDDLWPRLVRGLTTVSDMLGREDEAIVFAHGGLIYLIEERSGQKRGRMPNLGALWLNVTEEGEVLAGERVSLIDEGELTAAQSDQIL